MLTPGAQADGSCLTFPVSAPTTAGIRGVNQQLGAFILSLSSCISNPRAEEGGRALPGNAHFASVASPSPGQQRGLDSTFHKPNFHSKLRLNEVLGALGVF